VSIRCEAGSRERLPQGASEAQTDFASIIQQINADNYRGKRVRFQAFLKTTEAVGEGAALWFRVDGADFHPVAFDNMSEPDRMVRGTKDWKQYSIVLDVPTEAQILAYGALLTGRGQVWIDDASLEVVGKDVPETGAQEQIKIGLDAEFAKMPAEAKAAFIENGEQGAQQSAAQPENLDFE